MRLTPREREVLALVCSGYQTKQIAHRLGLAAGTVQRHRFKIWRKLPAKTPEQLGAMAVKRGII